VQSEVILVPSEQIAILIVGVFLFLYGIFGAIDFGASFWSMVFLRRNTEAGLIANRFLSPSWEVTNTFLVLLVVSFVSFFPKAAFTLGTVLLVPVSIVLVLISLRSAFMVFAHNLHSYQHTLRIISGVAGILIPILLISTLPITQGAFITIKDGTETLLFFKWLSHFSTYYYMLFGLTSELFLSSLFLADYAREAGKEETYQLYRRYAMLLGPITLISAIITLFVLEPEANWLLDNLKAQGEWFLLAILFYLVGYGSLWWPDPKNESIGKPRIAVLLIVFQYGIASYAYATAHMPYIVFPYMTITSGFTGEVTFRALFWVYVVGLAILLPGFYLFWRLFLKDKRYLRQEE
jgi:cytochrome d ubiquinol oxidase subunit II